MKLEHVTAERISVSRREQYLSIILDVFDAVDPKRLQTRAESLSKDTDFYTIESEGIYSSVLFVTPVTLAGISLGGIGGVCTRKEYRGRGYGRLVMERALRDTLGVYRALLLWTRIPDYFRSFGFIEMPELFIPDPAGSTPMFFFHGKHLRLTVSSCKDLPRDYF